MKHRYLFKIDFLLIGIVCVITLLGILLIGSAGDWVLDFSNFSIGPIMTKQLIGLGIGLILVLILTFLSRPLLKFLAIPSYLGMLFLLVLVLLFGVGTTEGTEAEDVRRWIPFIGGIGVQPSEFAKFLIIIALARFCEFRSEQINKPSTVAIYVLLMLIPMFLILKEPDLSTTIVVACICAVILFGAGLDWKWIVAALIIIGIAVALILYDAYREGGPKILNDYQATRIWAFFDPQNYAQDYAYQTLRSQYAISSGGLRGVGLFNNSGLVPVPMTDCIFGIMGEELGFFGTSVYLILLVTLISRILWIGSKSSDLFGKLICIGVATWISIQSLIHIGVTTGVLPNTGLPLPFVSYGVSSLISNMIGIGLVMNVYADMKAQTVRYETNEKDQFAPNLLQQVR